ncbi:MAG: ABC transporter substrate-binding protein, partial [bacterium]|nr:ABC transporter substrate-binding protein [bacterium]
LELGLIGNGPNDTLGDFDIGRVNEVIDLLAEIYVPQDVATYDPNVTATDIVTNEFIDPSIGLP